MLLKNLLHGLEKFFFAGFFSESFTQQFSLVKFAPGEMAERSNAAVLKTVEPARAPGVRIPLSPHNLCDALMEVFLLQSSMVHTTYS